MKGQKVFAWIGLVLGVAQIALMLASWLLTAAMPDDFVRSLLSAEGIRWFFGKFEGNLASPVMVWLLLGSISYGAWHKSRIFHYDRKEYRQRVAMAWAVVEFAIAVLMMMALTLLPHAILLNVMGGLFPSSFTQSFIPYCAFAVTVISITFGIVSGNLKGVEGGFNAMTYGISACAPLFVLYIIGMQLYESILYLQ